MSQPSLDFGIKRPVQNNPIVREIDKTRQREQWRSAVIGVCLVVVLLFSAWQQFELLRNGYEIELMEHERAQELELNRHLRLEIETLRAPARIERIATEQLNLVAPTSDDAQVLERLIPVAAPDSSIVVARDTGGAMTRRP